MQIKHAHIILPPNGGSASIELIEVSLSSPYFLSLFFVLSFFWGEGGLFSPPTRFMLLFFSSFFFRLMNLSLLSHENFVFVLVVVPVTSLCFINIVGIFTSLRFIDFFFLSFFLSFILLSFFLSFVLLSLFFLSFFFLSLLLNSASFFLSFFLIVSFLSFFLSLLLKPSLFFQLCQPHIFLSFRIIYVFSVCNEFWVFYISSSLANSFCLCRCC